MYKISRPRYVEADARELATTVFAKCTTVARRLILNGISDSDGTQLVDFISTLGTITAKFCVDPTAENKSSAFTMWTYIFQDDRYEEVRPDIYALMTKINAITHFKAAVGRVTWPLKGDTT